MASNNLACAMCRYTCNSDHTLIKHMIRYHRNDPHFIVTCQFCHYQSHSYIAYKKHILRCKTRSSIDHIESVSHSNIDDNETEMIDSCSDDDFMPSIKNENAHIDFSMASFFLKLEAKHGLTQTCINSVVEEVDTLLSQIIEKLKMEIKCNMKDQISDHVALDTCIADFQNSMNITSKFNSSAKRKKYFLKHFNLIIPRPQFISTEIKKHNNRIRHLNNYSYYVPFLDSLTALLNMPEVLYWVTRSHKSKDTTMRDWCDGMYCVQNKLNDHLQILLNIDDIETVNPIGMNKKIHKLTVVSYELANIPPQFRSSLHVKQLVAVCKRSL